MLDKPLGANDDLAHARQMICHHGYQGQDVCVEVMSTSKLPCPLATR